MDYYRVCRNAIVHPSDENSRTFSDYFREHHTDLADVRDRWQSVGHGKAPGSPIDLSFADVKLFARVALHVAEQISAAFDPGDDVLLALVRKDSWKHLAHDLNGVSMPLPVASRCSTGSTDRGLDRLAP